MTFNPAIPATGQSLGETRGPILQNFSDINTAFAVNHTSMEDSNDGKHLFLQMPEQTTPFPTTAVDEGALYTKVSTADTPIATLFWRQENSGTEIQMTGVDPVSAVSGHTFLPGGLMMQWATETATGGAPGSTLITFPVPFGAAPYSIVVTLTAFISANVVSLYPNTFQTDDFLINDTDSAGHSFNYIAIGTIA